MKPKQFTRAIPALLLLLTVACSKTVDTPVTPPPGTVQPSKISKIEFDDNLVEASYDANGNLSTVLHKLADGSLLQGYNFSYSGGKLSEVGFGGKWKYIYNGPLLTKVETHTAAGVLKYQVEFSYTHNRITEKTEYLVSSVGPRPYMRSVYAYHSNGNVSRMEIYQFVNGYWKKSEEIHYPLYDTSPNILKQFENYPYLPADLFPVNNPLKEVYYDDLGTKMGEVINEYTYDSKGRPVTRKATHQFPGFPDVVEVTKMYY